MRKFLVASHGKLAEGILTSVEMIIGKCSNVDYVCITPKNDNEFLENKINSLLEEEDENDELIILTDVFGGSVSNACMKYTKRKNIHVITGINLPILLELLSFKGTEDTHELIMNSIERGKSGIIYLNDLFNNNNK